MNIFKRIRDYYFGETIEDRIQLTRAYIGLLAFTAYTMNFFKY